MVHIPLCEKCKNYHTPNFDCSVLGKRIIEMIQAGEFGGCADFVEVQAESPLCDGVSAVSKGLGQNAAEAEQTESAGEQPTGVEAPMTQESNRCCCSEDQQANVTSKPQSLDRDVPFESGEPKLFLPASMVFEERKWRYRRTDDMSC